MLSKTSRYGVRSVLYLALHTDSSCLVGVRELAKRIQISEPMLSKILQNLTKRRLIESKKGRNGGFYMTDEQKSQHLINIITDLEQSNRLINDCLMGQKNCKTCDRCPYHMRVTSIRSELHSIYGTDTILETAIKLMPIIKSKKEII